MNGDDPPSPQPSLKLRRASGATADWLEKFEPEKVKAVSIARYGLRRSGSVLLSHNLICSTIAAERLNFRVRNGNGWIPLAIATEKVVDKFFSSRFKIQG